MAVRTAYVGTQVPGDVLTGANFTKVPGGWIGYAEVTANQGSITTAQTDLTGLSVAVTVGANRRIRITGYIRAVPQNATTSVQLAIKEGATQLNACEQVAALAGNGWTSTTEWVGVPSTGAHTYKLAVTFASGTTNSANASATAPAFILVEDIGPSA